MKRLLATVSVLVLSCGVAHFSVKADNITVSASSAVLMDAATGEVLFAKDADMPRAMASTTKLMTALLAAEYGDWSETGQALSAAARGTDRWEAGCGPYRYIPAEVRHCAGQGEERCVRAEKQKKETVRTDSFSQGYNN